MRRLVGSRWVRVSLALAVAVAVPAVLVGRSVLRDDRALAPTPTTSPPTTVPAPVATTTTVLPFEGWVDPASVGLPFEGREGVLTFRGNPTRTYYGTGPVPADPEILWSFPESAMCSESTVGEETTEWCGTGWTGQPSVFPRDGLTWVVFGAYDRAVHWLDAASGGRVREDLVTGDLIKGSVTIDPDGFPLVYVGSRDNRLRVIADDRDPPTELWSLDARDVSPTLWNDDWDGAPLVIDDYLFAGGENSQIHVVRLNRGYDGEGRVTVAPELVWNAPGWDDQLLADLGDSEVSIESSVAIHRDTLYLANSGGLVQGWDISGLALGFPPERTFRFWTGDDTDATVVVDEEGMLYVASEAERGNERSAQVGQIMKLDPSRPDDPLLWSVQDPSTERPAGVWATPALHRDVLYAPTDAGELLAIDRVTGAVRWSKQLAGPTWQSPVVVDDVLIQGDCSGALRAYDVSQTVQEPTELWSVQLDGCIESTPAVWGGRVYVGTRGGRVHAVGDPG